MPLGEVDGKSAQSLVDGRWRGRRFDHGGHNVGFHIGGLFASRERGRILEKIEKPNVETGVFDFK